VTARAAWAGIVVSDVAASSLWYARHLGAALVEQDARWAKLRFRNRSTIELFLGDLRDPAASFPSYGYDSGPAVMPGFAVDDPAEVAHRLALEVVRILPGWVVVACPDRLRLVLIRTDVRATGPGLVGFRFASPGAAEQSAFLGALGIEVGDLGEGAPAVVPIVRGLEPAELTDPDGTRIEVLA
jgi:catechol 2,3-dioxygenase-like lactoylglutathione lyase family enzyme